MNLPQVFRFSPGYVCIPPELARHNKARIPKFRCVTSAKASSSVVSEDIVEAPKSIVSNLRSRSEVKTGDVQYSMRRI